MICAGREVDGRRVGDSFGDVGDEGADEGALKNSWAMAADVGVPCLAM